MAKKDLDAYLVSVLVANRAHLAAQERRQLEAGAHIHGSFAVLSGPDGLLVFVPADLAPVQSGKGLASILRMAGRCGARYVLFDRNAECLPGGNTYAD